MSEHETGAGRIAVGRISLFLVVLTIVASPTFGRALRTGAWSGVVVLAVFAVSIVFFVRSLQRSHEELAARRHN